MQIRRLDPAEVRERAGELLALQHAAYAVEARLIGDDRIPPLQETETDLLDAELDWLVVETDDEVVGALGLTVSDGEVDIDRLMVAPSAHRRGVGRALVDAGIRRAERAIVATGRDNAPARALYASLGFRHLGDAEVIPGLWVSRFARP